MLGPLRNARRNSCDGEGKHEKQIKAKGEAPTNGKAAETIAVRLDTALLKRCAALAKKKRLSRDTLIARGLRAILAAEGE